MEKYRFLTRVELFSSKILMPGMETCSGLRSICQQNTLSGREFKSFITTETLSKVSCTLLDHLISQQFNFDFNCSDAMIDSIYYCNSYSSSRNDSFKPTNSEIHKRKLKKLQLQGQESSDKNLGYQCNFPCKKTFKTNSGLLQHQLRCHPGFDFLETHDVISKGASTDKKSKKKTVKCFTCQQYFDSPSQLNIHMNKHANTKAYKCPFCSNAYKFPQSLLQHSRKCDRNPKNMQVTEVISPNNVAKLIRHIVHTFSRKIRRIFPPS